MHRPEKVYLEEPITISGAKVNHTEAGLKYLIDHYKQMLSFPINEAKISSAVRQHYTKLIETYTFHLQLYEHERTLPAIVSPVHVPADHRDDKSEKEVSANMESLHSHGDATQGG